MINERGRHIIEDKMIEMSKSVLVYSHFIEKLIPFFNDKTKRLMSYTVSSAGGPRTLNDVINVKASNRKNKFYLTINLTGYYGFRIAARKTHSLSIPVLNLYGDRCLLRNQRYEEIYITINDKFEYVNKDNYDNNFKKFILCFPIIEKFLVDMFKHDQRDSVCELIEDIEVMKIINSYFAIKKVNYNL